MTQPVTIAPLYHTVVIGAGPAGVMAALRAAEAGTVLLVEHSTLPRDKSCGGMLNAYSQDFLGRLAEIPESIQLEPRWVNFRYDDWDRKIVKPTQLRFLNVDRRLFDEWMLSLLPAHVTVAAETRITAFQQDANGVHAVLQSGGQDVHVECRVLVGADGARSTVRRALGAAAAATYVTLQDFCVVEGTLEPYFDCVYIRDVGDCFGYGYVVPKGDTAIVGSVFYPKTKRPHEKHEFFVQTMREALPLGSSVRREAATALYLRSPSDVVPGRGRVLLAGEAGGWMSPTSGEGISYALNTGDLAGRAIAAAAGDPASALHNFERETAHIQRNIRRKLRWLPIMESRAGKYVAGFVPPALVSRVTEGL